MKKFIYSVLAVAALVACAKENKAPVNKEPVPTHKETIVASFSSETKTAYEGLTKFSWVAGDKIWVGVVKDGATNPLNSNYYDYVAFTAKTSGTTVEFEGEVPDYYRPHSDQIAYYPGTAQDPWYESAQSGFSCRLPISVFVGVEAPSGLTTYYETVPADNPLAHLPLIGSKQDDGTYVFKSGVGVLKLNLTDLEDSAAGVTLNSASGYLGNYLIVGSDRYIKNDKCLVRGTSSYGTRYVSYYFNKSAAGAATVYITVPVGTLAAGSSIDVFDDKGAVIFSKEFTKDVEIVRNKITELAPLKAKFDWVSVGKGKYKDAFLWNVGKFADEFVDVDIDVNEEGAYRIDPYKAAKEKFSYTPEGTVSGPLPLLITIQPDGYVYYDETPSGIYGGSYEYAVSAPYYWSSNYPSYYGSYGKGNNFVAKYDSDGKPANIIMSPVYTSVTTSSFTADNYIWANTIQLIFPGASEIDIDAEIGFIEIADDDPAAPKVKFAAYLGADIESLQIATGATPDEAAAAITAGENVTTVTATGEVEVLMPANSPSGNYYAVAKVKAAAGLAPVVDRYITSSEFHYDNPDADLGLDESVLYGQWSGDITWWRSGSYNSATFTITLAESQSPLEGNIVVTEFMGYEGTGSGYMDFNTATGALTIPNDTPLAKYNANYNLGMNDANSAGNGYFVFRYDPVAKTLSLEDIQFVGFNLYNVSDGADSGYWIGYCYGPSSNSGRLLLSKVDESNSFSAPAKKVDAKPVVSQKGKCSIAK